MKRIDEVMDKRVRDVYKQKDYKFLFYLAVVALLLLLVWIEYQENRIAIRAHNLNAVNLSQACGDLPLRSEINEAACEQAIGEFMLEETGLFR